MPIASTTDVNVISQSNSLDVPLGLNPNQSFTGTFTDVTGYTTITLTASTDIPAAAVRFEWSTDGTNIDSTTVFGDTSGELTVHATIRAKYFRVYYEASGLGQNYTRIQTLLRKGSISGGVSPVGEIIGRPDAQIVNAVIFARPLGSPTTEVSVFATDDPYLIVHHPPARSTFISQGISATTFFSPQLDFFGIFGPTRRFFTIFNNTIRGNLFIKFGGAASVSPTGYDYKIPPQGTWTMPYSWIPYSGTIFGIWDVAIGGEAHVMEAF